MSFAPLPSPILIIKRARKLLRCGKLSHTAYGVLDTLLWSCRPKSGSSAVVSYNALARLTHLAKITVCRLSWRWRRPD